MNLQPSTIVDPFWSHVSSSNGCAAHASRRLLTLDLKTCSLFTLITSCAGIGSSIICCACVRNIPAVGGSADAGRRHVRSNTSSEAKASSGLGASCSGKMRR